jgi:CRISPR-associated protein Cas2
MVKGSAVRCILVYDIPDDGKRGKIADICLDYGLDRIQYSAFSGQITVNAMGELFLKIKRTLGKKPGKISLYPICVDDWQKRKEIIQEE